MRVIREQKEMNKNKKEKENTQNSSTRELKFMQSAVGYKVRQKNLLVYARFFILFNKKKKKKKTREKRKEISDDW